MAMAFTRSSNDLLRPLRLAAVDGLQDRLVLVPHCTAPAYGLQHRTHGATDVAPVMVDSFGDERIAEAM
jgi:hypothetical protein